MKKVGHCTFFHTSTPFVSRTLAHVKSPLIQYHPIGVRSAVMPIATIETSVGEENAKLAISAALLLRPRFVPPIVTAGSPGAHQVSLDVLLRFFDYSTPTLPHRRPRCLHCRPRVLTVRQQPQPDICQIATIVGRRPYLITCLHIRWLDPSQPSSHPRLNPGYVDNEVKESIRPDSPRATSNAVVARPPRPPHPRLNRDCGSRLLFEQLTHAPSSRTRLNHDVRMVHTDGFRFSVCRPLFKAHCSGVRCLSFAHCVSWNDLMRHCAAS